MFDWAKYWYPDNSLFRNVLGVLGLIATAYLLKWAWDTFWTKSVRRIVTNDTAAVVETKSTSAKSFVDTKSTASSSEVKTKTVTEDDYTHGLNWEFYEDKAREFRWRAFDKVTKKQIGRSSEGFATMKSAKRNARLMSYEGGTVNADWEMYQDKANMWRWTATSKAIDEIVGASWKEFETKASCINNAKYFGYTGK
jgi:uncharacterized protein YegP (UPF0339 family)